jgi:hypothetical protein
MLYLLLYLLPCSICCHAPFAAMLYLLPCSICCHAPFAAMLYLLPHLLPCSISCHAIGRHAPSLIPGDVLLGGKNIFTHPARWQSAVRQRQGGLTAYRTAQRRAGGARWPFQRRRRGCHPGGARGDPACRETGARCCWCRCAATWYRWGWSQRGPVNQPLAAPGQAR